MNDKGRCLEAGSAAMVAQIDVMIGDLESRGWLVAAAKAEEFIGAIYSDAKVDTPIERSLTAKRVGNDIN